MRRLTQPLWLLGQAVAVGLLLAGCQDLSGQNDGTTAGLARCKEDGTKQGLASSVVDKFCIQKHSTATTSMVGGWARFSPAFAGTDRYYFNGSIVNSSNDVIITSFSITVSPKSGAPSSSKAFNGMWVTPGSSQSFAIDYEEVRTKPKNPEEASSEAWSWAYDNVRGIRIKI